MVPVFYQGEHLGSVEFGLSFGQAFFDNFKQENNVDVALYRYDGQGFSTFASTFGIRANQTLLSKERLLQAMADEQQFNNNLTVHGHPASVLATVVTDYSGKPIGVVELAMNRSHFAEAVHNTQSKAMFQALIALIIGIGLSLWVGRSFGRRIEAVAKGVDQVAQDNLVVDISDSGSDEIGALAKSAQAMRIQLHDMATNVRNNALAVQKAAQEIAHTVDSQAATSSEMSASVAEITSTMEELSASSTQIAEHSKSVVDIANKTYENSRHGSEAMHVVQGKMHDIQTDNQTNLQEILALGGKSKEISKVMEIINAVADQTKLIAFNAALEASSAGEAGQRFGVVAAEIRRLADSMTESTGEIEAKINEIQDSISRLVLTSEKGAKGIEEGMQHSSSTNSILADLVSAASETSSAAQQISISTQQQKTASSQVVVALREIVAASSNTADSMTQLSQVSNEMAVLSEKLGEVVGRFKLEQG